MIPKLIFLLMIMSIFSTLTNAQGNRHPDCLLPFETGLCRARFPRWGFDRATNKCRRFSWGGCGGNANSFENEKDCIAKCATKEYENIADTCSRQRLKCKNSRNINRSGIGFPFFGESFIFS